MRLKYQALWEWRWKWGLTLSVCRSASLHWAQVPQSVACSRNLYTTRSASKHLVPGQRGSAPRSSPRRAAATHSTQLYGTHPSSAALASLSPWPLSAQFAVVDSARWTRSLAAAVPGPPSRLHRIPNPRLGPFIRYHLPWYASHFVMLTFILLQTLPSFTFYVTGKRILAENQEISRLLKGKLKIINRKSVEPSGDSTNRLALTS